MIEEIQTKDFVNNSMMAYSAYVLTQRALPDFRDGQKPVQRRVLYSMKLSNTTKFTKSATVTGRVMEVHPHGDTYGTVVNLVQKDKQLIPLLEGKGSWGQFTSDSQGAAASRYTEVKLGLAAMETLKEIREKSINYVPNYDGTIMMPEVLPVTYPLVLTQASSGIGVGFASESLPFNLLEIRDVIGEYLKTGIIKTLVPDFATGGIILKDDEAFSEIMKTGRGSITIRSKVEIVGNKIIVNEIPYGVRRESIINKIIDLNKNKKLPEVTDVRDGTSFKGMKIVITLRKNVDANEVLEKLYHMTQMEAKANANTNLIYNGYPTVMSIEMIIEEWIKWRAETIKRGFQHKLKEMYKSKHLLEGLRKVLIDIDKAINIIRHEKDDLVIIKLKQEFNLDDIQADNISSIRLRNLNEDRIKKQINEIEKFEKDITQLEKNIEDEKFIDNEIISRMDDSIKKVNAKPRKSEIREISNKKQTFIKKIKKEVNAVENYETMITLTKRGYLFKMSSNGKMLSTPRIGDETISEIPANNADTIFALLPNGIGGTIKVDDINLNDGVFLPSYFECDEILGVIVPNEDVPHVLLGFDDGQLAKIPVESFIGNRKILKNGYYKGSKVNLIEQIPSDYDGDIEIKSGKTSKIVNISKINLKKGQLSRGQRFVKPKNNEIVTYNLI